jgi:stalled ribosome rescue protein Dom34
MEDGLAHLCLIKGHMSIIISKIEINIAKKRRGSNKRERNLNNF